MSENWGAPKYNLYVERVKSRAFKIQFRVRLGSNTFQLDSFWWMPTPAPQAVIITNNGHVRWLAAHIWTEWAPIIIHLSIQFLFDHKSRLLLLLLLLYFSESFWLIIIIRTNTRMSECQYNTTSYYSLYYPYFQQFVVCIHYQQRRVMFPSLWWRGGADDYCT